MSDRSPDEDWSIQLNNNNKIKMLAKKLILRYSLSTWFLFLYVSGTLDGSILCGLSSSIITFLRSLQDS